MTGVDEETSALDCRQREREREAKTETKKQKSLTWRFWKKEEKFFNISADRPNEIGSVINVKNINVKNINVKNINLKNIKVKHINIKKY